MQNITALKIPSHPIHNGSHKENMTAKTDKNVGKEESLLTASKLMQPPKKSVWRFLNLKIELPYYPARG